MILTRLSLVNRLMVALVTLAVSVMGVVTMTNLKLEMLPSMSVPAAFVSVTAEGLAPEEMTSTVTEPLESALQAVPGVNSVFSVTSAGSASITVQWPFQLDVEETSRAIKAAADSVKSALPKNAQLEVFTGTGKEAPAIQLSAGTSGKQEAFETALAQQVLPKLKAISGVQKAELSGRQEQRIVIDLRAADVAKLKVDPAQLSQLVEARGQSVSAGQAGSAQGPQPVSVGTRLGSLEDLQNLPVVTESSVVLLKDFADVHLEKVPAGSISRVNGKPSLTLIVTAAQGANIVEVSHAVNAVLKQEAGSLKGEFVTLFDPAPAIEQSIHDLSVEGGLGLAFAVLVVLAFLWSWRSTIIAAVSIPISLLITMIGLFLSNNTLNMLTLGALTIAIGRIVDDSIVVIENITRRAHTAGVSVRGIIQSVRQVAAAITASTLTTVAVFLPIVFVSGIAGQLFRPFAVTVSVALLASLLVSLTIIPVLAYWFMRGRHQAKQVQSGETEFELQAREAREARDSGGTGERDREEANAPEDRLQRTIMPWLRRSRRHPVVVSLVSFSLLGSTLVMAGMIPTDFLGSSGNETLQLTQTPGLSAKAAAALEENPEDAAAEALGDPVAGSAKPAKPASQEDLLEQAKTVEKTLQQVAGIKFTMTTIPVGGDGLAGPATINYSLTLNDGQTAQQVSKQVQRQLDKLPNKEEFQLLTKDAFGAGGDSGGAIDVRIQGNDPIALGKANGLLEKKLKGLSGVQSVRSELVGEQSSVRIKLDEARAAKIGFDRASVGRAVQDALQGSQIGQLMLDGEQRTITLRTPGSERTATEVGEILLPVTAQQNAEAQKIASDALQQKAMAEADAAKAKAARDVQQQIAQTQKQRSDLAASLAPLRQQLTELTAQPVVPLPLPSDRERAQAQRAEQIAQLESSISQAEQGVQQADEQIAQIRQGQIDTIRQQANEKRSEAEQKAAQEARGTALRVKDIATVVDELVPQSIIRAEGQRKVSISVVPEQGQLSQVTAAVNKVVRDTEMPLGVTFDIGGLSEQQDEAFSQLGIAMLAAIMLVLIVMIATFRNFRQPMVLLVSIPFAATGAILGLLVTGTALGLPALIGLLMLVGIVVTNAIVLMDLINRLRADGVPLAEAVDSGTRLRLRPILMTAAATVFALVPMSLGLTGGGAFISRPLAIVVIGGLVSSTLLTLVLVPILYTAVERRRENRVKKRADHMAARAAEARAVR